MRVRIYEEVAKPLQEEPIGFPPGPPLVYIRPHCLPLLQACVCAHLLTCLRIHTRTPLPTCVNACWTPAQQEFKAIIKILLDVAKLLSKQAVNIVSAHLPITLNQLLNICQIFQVEDGISF